MNPPEWFKKLAVPLANKIVFASDAYVGLKSTINDMSGSLIDFSRPPAGPADERLLEFAQLIRPWTYEGLELIRVGGDHDGGYVMANEFGVSGAISIGVGRDVSWDRDVAGRGIPVVMFDPTVRKPPDRIDGARFIRVGLGPKGSQGPFRPLTQLLDLAQMSRDKSLLLKIDVEGAEWKSLADLDAFPLGQFSQIVIEMHELSRMKYDDLSTSVLQVARALSVGHLPIHVHANNYDSLVRYDSNWFPDSIEVSYFRREGLPSTEVCPRVSLPIDSPCDPRAAEIDIESLADLSPSGHKQPFTD